MTSGSESTVALFPRPATSARRRLVTLVGPAFVASVAYIDPGNFATNFQSGATFGYMLLWVVVLANVVAMLLQYLTAKLGVATGRSLPEMCRETYRRPVVLGLWLQAELVVIMTDLAELVGGAIALHLLFGAPLLSGGLLVAAASFVILAVRTAGQRRFEGVIAATVAVVAGVFFYQTLAADIDVRDAAAGLVPRLDGTSSLMLAAGVVGATVMPHAVYLHSALTKERFAPGHGLSRPRLLRAQRTDVLLAMGFAGLINAAMLLAAAGTLHGTGMEASLEGAHAQLMVTAGVSTATLFAIALLASGLASSSVGVYAGEIIMQGFLRRRIPLYVRRLVAVVPALAVLGSGMDATEALVLSQVVLSVGIPFVLVPLVLLTRRADLMGRWVNRRITTALAIGATVVITVLDIALVMQTLAV
ncbi:Nramp family divalent metal transporter [Streptomyces sp. NPDC046862]|uniref:Nramp family divalent metal transporter n=1 Tax=Streptomyces sp. NPDC046862 TaxID=3154603 RepID=UPI003452661F